MVCWPAVWAFPPLRVGRYVPGSVGPCPLQPPQSSILSGRFRPPFISSLRWPLRALHIANAFLTNLTSQTAPAFTKQRNSPALPDRHRIPGPPPRTRTAHRAPELHTAFPDCTPRTRTAPRAPEPPTAHPDRTPRPRTAHRVPGPPPRTRTAHRVPGPDTASPNSATHPQKHRRTQKIHPITKK